MPAGPDLDRLARVIGDPTRLRMLALLMDGRALTAKELAYGAGVGPATATSHLRRLLGDALVTVRAQGRHKYFRLGSPEVGRCIEMLMVVAQPGEARVAGPVDPQRAARFCYDHLAGKLGTGMADALVRRRRLEFRDGRFVPTRTGERWLRDFGLEAGALEKSRRQLAPACLDWSERRDHIGGALGAALAERLLSLRWIRRLPDSRAVVVTPAGRAGLTREVGFHFPA
jgi:DNA-binding transcriptional ArsR family regulator